MYLRVDGPQVLEGFAVSGRNGVVDGEHAEAVSLEDRPGVDQDLARFEVALGRSDVERRAEVVVAFGRVALGGD